MAGLTDYGFPFNSVASDRTYAASVWREYFKAIFTNGVINDIGNKIEITESDTPAKSVKVNTGQVIINGAMYEVDAFETVNIADNASGNPRIDRIVARLDYVNRLMEIDVVAGTPAASPTAPALTQTVSTYEISLALVAVANGFTTIEDAQITDQREFSKTIGQKEFEDENDLLQYDRSVETLDAFGNPIDVRYTRPSDDSLFLKRVYTNADAYDRYQTITESFYLSDGTTVYKTIVYTLTYFDNGIVDTMTRVVS